MEEYLKRFSEYLRSYPLSKITVKNYLSDVRHFSHWSQSYFREKIDLNSVTPQIIDIYKEVSGILPRTFSRHLSSLRRFFKFLGDQGIISQGQFQEIIHSLSLHHILIDQKQAYEDKWHIREFKNHLYLENLTRNSIKNYLGDIKNFCRWLEQIAPHEEEHQVIDSTIREIRPILIEEYKDGLLNVLHLKPQSINRKLSSIRRYIEFATAQGLIKEFRTMDYGLGTREEKISLEDLPSSEVPTQPKYSRIPPIRLFQRLFEPYEFLEKRVAGTIARLVRNWQLEKKGATGDERLAFSPANIKKELYVPHAISTKHWTIHKKTLYHIRYTRPKWYKKYHSYSFSHQFHFAVLIIYSVGISILLYRNLFPQTQEAIVFAAREDSLTLPFVAHLRDRGGNAIASPQDLRFSIYSHPVASGSALLWQEVHHNVLPSDQGFFSLTLGGGNPIPKSFFGGGERLYLGVTIGTTQELTPREPLPQTGFAGDSRLLQGMQVITDPATPTSNVILALDSSGNLTIGGNANPTFQATGGKFSLSGTPLVLTTNIGSAADIKLAPDLGGKIDLLSPLINSTDSGKLSPGAVEINDKFAISASESATAAFIVNNEGTGDILTASTSGITRFVITGEGNIGIGTSTPLAKLDLEGSVENFPAARIFNTEGGESSQGLTIKLGSLGDKVSKNSRFISFETIGLGNVGGIRGNDAKGLTYETGSTADFAEYFKKDEGEKIPYGSLVCLDETGLARLCSSSYTKVVGVASRNPAFLGGEPQGTSTVPVGILGIVETEVATVNGSILPGDPLTFSFIKGVGVLARGKGVIVGNALEVFSEKNSYPCPGFELLTCGKIKVYVHVTWWDPEVYLTNTGDLNISDYGGQTTEDGLSLKDYIVKTVSEILNSQELISPVASIDQIHTNIISPLASDVTIHLGGGRTDSPEVDYSGGKLIIENASGSAVATVDSQGNASFSGSLTASSSSFLASDVQSLTSKEVYTEGLEARSATISGTLRADRIVTNEIDLSDEALAKFEELQAENLTSDVSSLMSNYIDISTISAQFALINEGLISIGPSTFGQVSVMDSLSLGTNFIFSNNSINVLGGDFEIQPLKQGGISLFSGLIYFDSEGNVRFGGNAEFERDVTVKGRLATNIISPLPDQDLILQLRGGQYDTSGVAEGLPRGGNLEIRNATGSAVLTINQAGDLVSSGSGTFAKLNLGFVREAYALSPDEVIATGSASVATISAGFKELTVRNSLITEDSLVYITPLGEAREEAPYLLRQTPETEECVGCGSFTVGVPRSLVFPLPFNFLIIN